MIKKILPLFALCILVSVNASAQKKKKSTVPRDSITNKFAYHHVSDSIMASKAQLADRLDKWIAQNYNTDDKNTAVEIDGDTYMIHGRDQMQGASRRFIEYDLTVDLKENKYRYKMTDFQYIVSGRYALEDKRATDKKRDLEEIDGMMRKILNSLDAHMKKGDDW